MATGTNGIATYGDLNNKIKCAFSKMSDAEKQKCPTKEELTNSAPSWLWTISDSLYPDATQCIKYSDIGINKSYSITVKIYNGRGSGTLGINWIDINLIAPDGQTVELTGADWSDNIANGSNVTKTLTFNIPTTIGSHTVNLANTNYNIQVRIGELASNRALRFYAYSNSEASSTKYHYKNEEIEVKIGQITFPFNYTSGTSSCFLGGYDISRTKYVYVVGSNT